MKLSKLFLLVITLFSFTTLSSGKNISFLSQQKKYPRVRTAILEKETLIREELRSIGIGNTDIFIFIRIFKMEKILQLWVKKTNADTFSLLKIYGFCSSCGDLGPKRHQGDFQIPEGFYHIDRFNPHSIFFLSLGINYPNVSDHILGGSNPGGDIFIHGNCVTIGCVPITDDKIKELYLYAVYARNSGQKKIPVHIFPYRFNSKNSMERIKHHISAKVHQDFWQNLKEGYDIFDETYRLPKVSIIRRTGKYAFTK